MKNKIIDNVQTLVNMNADDLTELLLDEKYNKPNLRELVRRLVANNKDLRTAFEYEHSKNKRLMKKYEKISEEMSEFFRTL